MIRCVKQKKKLKTEKKQQPENSPFFTDELISKIELESENIIRLKLTTGKELESKVFQQIN